MNDLCALEVETLVWRKVRCHGDLPPPRYGHSLCMLGSRIFIFGGRTEKSKYLNDIYMLDLDTYIWAKVSTSTSSPLPRMGHTCVMVGTRMAMFGGYNGNKTFDDFWVFNTENASWMNPVVEGKPPLSRYNHMMNLTHDGRILIIAGCHLEKGFPTYLRDLVQLNTETMTWERPRVMGDMMIPAMGCTSLLFDNQLVVFGGWTGVEKCIICGVVQSKGRNAGPAHQPDCILGRSLLRAEDSKDPMEPIQLPYMRVLNVDTFEWRIPESVERPCPPRYGHSMIQVGAHILIFAGWDDTGALADLVALQVKNLEVASSSEEQ